MVVAWGPWVRDMMDMIDGKGTLRHLYWPGSLSEQPARDMAIYNTARGRWVERMNEEMRKA